VYSYLQYHWWPIALIDIQASADSSSIYNKIKEGIAICTKITAGIIVQTDSIICISKRVLLTLVLNSIATITHPTKVITNKRIMLIKSCKNNNSSMTGEFAS